MREGFWGRAQRRALLKSAGGGEGSEVMKVEMSWKSVGGDFGFLVGVIRDTVGTRGRMVGSGDGHFNIRKRGVANIAGERGNVVNPIIYERGVNRLGLKN